MSMPRTTTSDRDSHGGALPSRPPRVGAERRAKRRAAGQGRVEARHTDNTESELGGITGSGGGGLVQRHL
eukprot:6199654-Pleurochrysis_carterae.AAC.2